MDSSGACVICTSLPGFYCPEASTGAASMQTPCPVGFFCPGGSADKTPCTPATACSVAGLSAQPPCYWSVDTLAGSGAPAFADGLKKAAAFYAIERVRIDLSGNYLIAESDNHRVRRVTPSGLVSTIAGSGLAGFVDGVSTSARFNKPFAAVADPAGTGLIYVADANNNRLRAISEGGTVTTVCGSGSSAFADGTGTLASFSLPVGVALDGRGRAFIADFNNQRLRVVQLASATVSTFAGDGIQGWADGMGTAARLNTPNGISIDTATLVVYWVDYEGHRVRSATAGGLVSTIAGSGSSGTSNGLGTSASFSFPRDVNMFGTSLVVADGGNGVIRLISPAGLVTTIAGSGAAFSVDGWGTAATLKTPHGVAADAQGMLLVGEEGGNVLRTIKCTACPSSHYCSSGSPVLCPAGSYCPPFSTTPTPCPAGTFSSAVGAASSTTCAPCSAGFFSGAGAVQCTPCPAGTMVAGTGNVGLVLSPSCDSANEGSSVYLSCSQPFTSVLFASFGTPANTWYGCPELYSAGSCNSPSSVAVVGAACLGKTSCTIVPSSSTFGGDPCEGTYKRLAVALSCSSSS